MYIACPSNIGDMCTEHPSQGTHFSAELTEAMQIKYLAQGNNILLPGFEPSTSVSRNRHSGQTINMLCHLLHSVKIFFTVLYDLLLLMIYAFKQEAISKEDIFR